MMLDRFTQHTVDPLALMSNVSHQQTSLNTRNQATVQDDRVVVQNIQGRQYRGQGNNAGHIARNCTQPKRPQNSEYFKDKVLLMQAQENRVALDEEQLLFIAGGQDNVVDEDINEQPVQDLALNVDNVFQVDDCDAFDYDVNEAPTAQTMFMANLSSADHVYDESGPSYDLDILSEVHDNDHYQDDVCEHHEVHEMHGDVQPNYVVDLHVDYTSDSNMIPYDQYVKNNAGPVVQSNVSSVPNDAYMMILNDMHEQPAQYASVTTQNNVVDKSLTAELATYKEQVELYERRAKFELTEREQKIDEQLRIVITDRNIKEENLKRELHSVKMQLTSTINHNKSMVEEVTSLKKDFKQKENKYLEEFLDMKALKEKVEDKLYKQDQSLQTVHMLCKPKPYYDEQKKVAIGYKNPLCLTRAKQVQPALYNGHEIIKTNHVPAIVHNSEDTLEIAEITRKKMNEKMKDPDSTNEIVNTVHSVSAASSKDQASTASYADVVMFTLFSNQSNAPQLDKEVLEQIDADDLGEIDLKWKAEEGLTNFALMAYTSQGSSSSDSEREALNKSNLEIIGYQMGLESLEARIVVHEMYDVQVKDISIKDLKNQLEEALKEKDDLKLKLEKFKESSKNLTKLINSQISAKDKTGLGYDGQMNESEVVHSVFNSRESDVDDNPVNDRLKTDESVFKSAVRKTTTSVPETETSISKTSKDIIEKPKTVRPSAPIIEEWDTDSDNDRKQKQTHRQVEYPRKSQSPRGNRRNWNGMMTQKLRIAVATKSGQVPVNAAKQSSPRAATSISTARPVNTVAPKPKVNDALPITYSYFQAHSPVNNVTTARPKAVVSAAEGNGENVVKSSACWIWRPTGNVIDHISKDSGSYMLKRFDYGNPQYTLQDQGIFDSGCSRHMTGNKSFLTDYQEIDGGFVAFEGNAKRGKITGKGKIKTRKLDFEDVYFVKELKFNLFSVSQICDKKNSVLFTETECLVLSPDFKLLDESQVLLKDETPEILKNFITGIENQIDHKVKTIRCDNETNFKNRIMNEFCEIKGIRMEFSVARTPQQIGVAERKNRTLIETARTILADSKLPTTF
ncbi:integrase, catalytic region, zinc finger, CCHC-type containing protein [Tanacetum coccineum]